MCLNTVHVHRYLLLSIVSPVKCDEKTKGINYIFLHDNVFAKTIQFLSTLFNLLN